MKRRLVGLLSVALLVPPLAPSAAPHVLVVRCGTLITDAARAPLRDATIIVTDRIITAVGAGLAAKHFASFKLALAAGVTMAAGADDFYQPDRPAGLPSELVTDVKYGMEPQQALVTAIDQ